MASYLSLKFRDLKGCAVTFLPSKFGSSVVDVYFLGSDFKWRFFIQCSRTTARKYANLYSCRVLKVC